MVPDPEPTSPRSTWHASSSTASRSWSGCRSRPAAAAAAVPSPGAPGGPLVNLNTATEAELDTLPEVGPVTAQSILAWRDQHGGFTSVDELLEVDGIGTGDSGADRAPSSRSEAIGRGRGDGRARRPPNARPGCGGVGRRACGCICYRGAPSLRRGPRHGTVLGLGVARATVTPTLIALALVLAAAAGVTLLRQAAGRAQPGSRPRRRTGLRWPLSAP